MLTLAEFQKKAMSSILESMESSNKEVVLKSPTGSGKTIMLTHFMKEYLDQHVNYVFVWLSPGKGELELQSKEKMDKYFPHSSTKLLHDVMVTGFKEQDVCFINWEKLTKKSNKALKESEKLNFKEWVTKAKDSNIEFVVIIDESHQNDTIKAQEVINIFEPQKIIRASATPIQGKNIDLIEVDESEVIEAGLIKKMLIINEGFTTNIDVENALEFLLDKALSKQAELVSLYREYGSKVNPLILIQLPNNNDLLSNEVESILLKKNISVDNGSLAIWLNERKEHLENITFNQGFQRVLIMKQAIATGWDCPRAQILIKLRDNTSETFEIQTIGRIRRMPEAFHYMNDILDSSYIYTFDEKFTEGIKVELGQGALNAKILNLKEEFFDLSFIKEEKSGLISSVDAKIALKTINEYYLEKLELGVEIANNIKIFEKNDYKFLDYIVRSTLTGEIIKTDKESIDLLDTVTLKEKADVQRLNREYHYCLTRISRKVNISYENISVIVKRLFGTSDSKFKLIKLENKMLYSFIINNIEKLIKHFGEAISSGNNHFVQRNMKLLFDRTFKFPTSFLFTYDAENRYQEIYTKNVYNGYLSSAEKRSDSEKSFEEFCENCSNVKWIYKNGDKGIEYFSIGYHDNAGNTKLFYPDYIVKVNDEIWIIETKGGFTRSGKSEDIDVFSSLKFKYLKNYAEKHNLKMGFVRKDKSNNKLFICTDEYHDDIKNEKWTLLLDVFS